MWKFVLGFVLAAFLSLRVGLLLGEANSPDYDNEISSFLFIVTNAKVRATPEGKIIGTVRAGWTDYLYDHAANTVVAQPRFADVAAGYKPPKRWASFEMEKFEALTGAAAVTEGGLLAQFARQAKAGTKWSPKHWHVTAVTRVGIFTGGAVGYFWGYEDTMDYESDAFKKAALDVKPWNYLARMYEKCRILKQLSHNLEQERPATNGWKVTGAEGRGQAAPFVLEAVQEQLASCRPNRQFAI